MTDTLVSIAIALLMALSGATNTAPPAVDGWPISPDGGGSTLAAPPSAIGEPAEAVSGWATWFDACSDCAAAGPAVRRMLGRDWRGQWVRVTAGDSSVRVKLTDWCACGPRHGTPTVIDLSRSAFRALAPLGKGIVRVVVESVSGPGRRLPATDTE